MTRPLSPRVAFFLLATVALFAAGCPGARPKVVTPPSPARVPDDVVVVRTSASGLGFRLSNADAEADAPAPRPVAPAITLGAEDAKRITARLSALASEPDDAKDFALRPSSLPAPRAGKTVNEPFPPAAPATAPPAPASSGPLVVERRAPEGPVELAPHLSLTFNQPMVPVSSVEAVSASKPPVVLVPEPPGKWRWLGTRTLMFQPDKRFPMATEYAVEVPAGTTSTIGGKLARPEKFTFTTPPPKVLQSHPSDSSVPLDPTFFVGFDQVVTPEALLPRLALVSGRGSVPLRLATSDEVESDRDVRALAQEAEKGRWVALRATQPLAPATAYRLVVKPGAKSAEGPRTTTSEQAFGFTTYGPLQVTSHGCMERSNGVCHPLASLPVTFSNRLDASKFDRALVSVSPEVQGLRIDVSDRHLFFTGRTKGRTTYTVTLAAGLTDVYGQTLGKETKLDIVVGSADPVLFGAERDMIVLDPASPRTYAVWSVNEPGLRARVYAVEPRDWAAYVAYRDEWERPRKLRMPGRLVREAVLKPRTAPDELVATEVDFAPALAHGKGQVVVLVEPTRAPPRDRDRPELAVWLQATSLGLVAYQESDRVSAWVSDLATGAPKKDVQIAIEGGPVGTKTDASGVGRVDLGIQGSLVVARDAGDVAFLPSEGQQFERQDRLDALRWLVYADRRTYKPGERVRLKGWLRGWQAARGGDLAAVPQVDGATVTFRVRDARSSEIAKGDVTVDAAGSFDLAFDLPGNAYLGPVNVELALDGGAAAAIYSDTEHTYWLSVQEFRRPDFEVSVRASEGPHLVGKHAVASVSASYFAGGGLAGAPVTWRVGRSFVPFAPPNRPGFHFGPASERLELWRVPTWAKGKPATEILSAKTDAAGVHRLRLDFDALEPSYPMILDLMAEVVDVNRQQWAATSALVVHPADRAVGLRLAKASVRGGERADVDVLVTDLDGKAVAGRPVKVALVRTETERQGDAWVARDVEVASCDVTSTTDVARCTLPTGSDGGSHKIVAIVTDEVGRRSQTDLRLWVFGREMPKDRGLTRGTLELVPDARDHEPGQTAELLVVSPFAPAEGVLTLRRQGVVHFERFSMSTASQLLRVKLEDAMVPGVTARVDLVGADVRHDAAGAPDPSLAKQPAFASGEVTLGVLPTARRLDVTVRAAKAELEPGAKTEIAIEVKDREGRGVPNATVAVVVADEAVLALSGYKTPDPVAVFYPPVSEDVVDHQLRDRVVLAAPDVLALRNRPLEGRYKGSLGGLRGVPMVETSAGKPSPPPPPPKAARVVEKKKEASMRDESVVGKATTPIAARTNFAALAAFAPRVTTDAAGRARLPLALPDNLTRYRVMAVASAGERLFGAGESTITARLAVMARISAPRFLNFGDRFELPVVVQNQTDAPVDVGIVARATNATVAEPSAKRVKVPANDRVEVRFDATTVKPGTARFQIGVASGGFSDASQVEVPVWTPATTEAFATYGEIDEGAIAQTVKAPANVFPQFGGLEITTSATQLQALTDAFLYLVRYPFEGNEQLASRVVSIAALRDVLSAFQVDGMPQPAALEAFVKEDLDKLKRRQRSDGGWGFWSGESWPYLSVHVAHALVRAKEKGYAPDATMLQRANLYLRTVEWRFPAWYSPAARRTITAYALFVLKKMNDADPGRARRLLAEAGGVDKLPIEAVGWLWPTISGDPGSAAENLAIRRHVANRAEETAGAARFTSSYEDGAWVLLHSDRRADGVLLDAMIGADPGSTLIPKVARGLLAHRTKGRWSNTQENAFVLLALDRYFATYEKVTPDFVARAWLGDRFAGEHAFKGRTTEESRIRVPMAWMTGQGASLSNVVLGKDGPGRLYYRLGMQYAPADLKLPPTDQGFVVSRLYEAVDDPKEVRRELDGAWRVKAGARVRTRVTMVTPTRRYHVALVDPLPAGFEAMNGALAVTGEVPKDPKEQAAGGRYGFWSRTWYEHQNLRDERAEVFTSLLWDGVWDYAYVSRATTPGTFVVPPAKVEEMYSPEVFGRGAGDRVIVE